MSPPPDRAVLLRQMRERGEISDAEYDVLRRDSQWGSPRETRRVASERQVVSTTSPSTTLPARRSGSALIDQRETDKSIRRLLFSRLTTPRLHLTLRGHVGLRQRQRRRELLISTTLVMGLVAIGVWWFVIRADAVRASDYARSVCSATRSWQESVTQARDTLTNALSTNPSPTQLSQAMLAFYQNIEQRTVQLAQSVEAAGYPDVSGGHNYAALLYDKIAVASQNLNDDTNEVRAFDPAQPTGLQLRADNLLGSLTGRTTKVTDALTENEVPAGLREAFDAEPTCSAFTG